MPDPKTPGGLRVSSAAFDNDPDENNMSVNLADVMATLGIPEETMMVDHLGFSLVAVTAEVVRAVAQAVMRDRLAENEAHALVCGEKTRSSRRYMATRASWVIRP